MKKKFLLIFLLTLSAVGFGGYITYFDTTYGVGTGYSMDGWEFWLGYPYIGTSFRLGPDYAGIKAAGSFDPFTEKRSWGYGNLYVDLSVLKLDSGIKFGYDETEPASSDVLPTVGDISYTFSAQLSIWRNFSIKAGIIYPFLVYKYINEVEKSFIPPPPFSNPLPFDIFLGINIEDAFFRVEFLYFIRFSTIIGYPSPLFNMNNLQISIKLYQ